MDTLPLWAYIAGGVVLVALLGVGGFFLGKALWKAFVRRYLMRLIGGREGLLAGKRTLERVLSDVSAADVDGLVRFASDPNDEDRKALADLSTNMQSLADEMALMPLPKRLWPAGEALSDVGTLMFQQARAVAVAQDGEAALSALLALDVEAVQNAADLADERLRIMGERYDMEEAAVYGGGLYI